VTHATLVLPNIREYEPCKPGFGFSHPLVAWRKVIVWNTVDETRHASNGFGAQENTAGPPSYLSGRPWQLFDRRFVSARCVR
jgi:hypothetical protein